MNKDIIFEWNPWWSKKSFFKGISRKKMSSVLPWIDKKEIIAIFGVRRSGKTTFLYQLIDHILQKNCKGSQVFFIKGDDDRIDKKDLINVSIKEYQKIMNPEDNFFLFIDEVQEIENWDKTLKRIYDLNPNIKIFISGSNSMILKDELANSLAGRFAYFEIYPFDFIEFSDIKGVSFEKEVDLIKNKKYLLNFLDEFLRFGGFPEVVLEKNVSMKKELIMFYFDSIFYRDVIKRNKVRNAEKIESLLKYFLQNISSPANYSKIGRLLGISTDSVGEYTKYFEDAYVVFSVNVFAHSYKKQVINPKKMYCVDLGIRNFLGFNFSDDFGKLYENLVFLKLKVLKKEIYYWKSENEKEIDFVVKEGKKFELFQVCYSVDTAETKKREIEGLIEGMIFFNVKEGFVITEDFEYEEIIGKFKVHYIPLWKWLFIY